MRGLPPKSGGARELQRLLSELERIGLSELVRACDAPEVCRRSVQGVLRRADLAASEMRVARQGVRRQVQLFARLAAQTQRV